MHSRVWGLRSGKEDRPSGECFRRKEAPSLGGQKDLPTEVIRQVRPAAGGGVPGEGAGLAAGRGGARGGERRRGSRRGVRRRWPSWRRGRVEGTLVGIFLVFLEP